MSGLSTAKKGATDIDTRFAILAPGSGLASEVVPRESILSIEVFGDVGLPLVLADTSNEELTTAQRAAQSDMLAERTGK